jgi:LPS O-antigen subunit length determinant protein (WzzB/FepE family)
LDEIVGRPEDWYLHGFSRHATALLEVKENTTGPIRSFLAGSQRSIYDQAAKLLQTHDSNLNYLAQDVAKPVKEILTDPKIFRGSRMRQLKAAVSNLEKALNDQLAAERTKVLNVIDSKLAELTASTDYSHASAIAQKQITDTADAMKRQIESASQIALLTLYSSKFEDTIYPGFVDLTFCSGSDGEESRADRHEKTETVSIRSIKVFRSRISILQTEHDVNVYLDAYRAELLKAIHSGKRVTL